MKALAYNPEYNNFYLYWHDNFAHLFEYPEYRNLMVAYEPNENILIPGEFL